ncbi:MAG: DnaJ C-terminal domain-containing protein, partial [Cellulomonas sp.]
GGMFGGGGGFRQPRRGGDVTATTTLPFRQAASGSTVTLSVDGRNVTARVPAGVSDGQKIRLRGKGQPGESGAPAGDLVITVSVTPHPLFSLDGNNVRITVPVAFDEAALGAQIDVPTLDASTVKVKVPEGTPSGRTLRVRGKGITTPKGTGDLLVTVQVVVPQRLTGAAKDAVRAFAQATSDADVRGNLMAQARV